MSVADCPVSAKPGANGKSPPRPRALPVRPEGIPQELKDRDQWVTWRYILRDGKWTKPPYDPISGRGADSTDPTTWGSFQEVYAEYLLSRDGSAPWDGIGYVLSDSDPYTGGDLDKCRDPQTGQFRAWTDEERSYWTGPVPDPEEIIASIGGYTDVSPSATGIKFIVRAKLPAANLKRGHIELYDSERYFTITGHVYGEPLNGPIPRREEAVKDLYNAIRKPPKPKKAQASSRASDGTGYVPRDDEVIAIAGNAANGQKFGRLFYDGNTSGYASPSEADAALAGILVFWTQDSDQIERIMRRSGLARDKWDTARGNSTYLRNTIEFVLKDVDDCYEWPHAPAGTSDYTDMGNAQRFVKQHGENARYCHPWKKWLIWDGRRWAIDETAAVQRLAKETARGLLLEAWNEPDPDKCKSLTRHAMDTQSSGGLAAMVKTAASEPGIPILPKEIDSNPWLLNCLNGTLDLRSASLRPHDRRDCLTKLVPVEFLPDSPCPLWEATLNRIFDGNRGLIEFIQRWAGYALTGLTVEHILPIWFGKGANGKSTVAEALMHVWGPDYSAVAARDMLTAKRNDSHPTELADLHGKRLVVASETDEGRKLAEGLVKDLTGGTKVKARKMREDFWEFEPTHKIVICTNHKPEIVGTDHAIWRRILLVPFLVIIPENEQDKFLSEKLKAESAGILAWCVRGCIEWQRIGLHYPDEVKVASAEYRKEQDVLGVFLADRCTMGDGCKVRAREVYRAYKTWCETNGELPAQQRRFGASLTERGFRRYLSNGTWYSGIELRKKATDGGRATDETRTTE